MELALDILGWIALGLGGFFCLVGAIGLNRMPDLFTRMHSVSVAETLGVGLLILGMLSQTTDWTVAVRLGIILVVLWTTGAVASHALARAALYDGAKPVLAAADGTLAPVDCADVQPELAMRLAMPLASEEVDQSANDVASAPWTGPENPDGSTGPEGRG